MAISMQALHWSYSFSEASTSGISSYSEVELKKKFTELTKTITQDALKNTSVKYRVSTFSSLAFVIDVANKKGKKEVENKIVEITNTINLYGSSLPILAYQLSCIVQETFNNYLKNDLTKNNNIRLAFTECSEKRLTYKNNLMQLGIICEIGGYGEPSPGWFKTSDIYK